MFGGFVGLLVWIDICYAVLNIKWMFFKWIYFFLPINFYFSIKIFLGKFIYLLIINNDNFKQLFIIINKNVLNYLKFLLFTLEIGVSMLSIRTFGFTHMWTCTVLEYLLDIFWPRINISKYQELVYYYYLLIFFQKMSWLMLYHSFLVMKLHKEEQ